MLGVVVARSNRLISISGGSGPTLLGSVSDVIVVVVVVVVARLSGRPLVVGFRFVGLSRVAVALCLAGLLVRVVDQSLLSISQGKCKSRIRY